MFALHIINCGLGKSIVLLYDVKSGKMFFIQMYEGSREQTVRTHKRENVSTLSLPPRFVLFNRLQLDQFGKASI